MADVEKWDQKKIMHYFNDKQAFEKYYTNVSKEISQLFVLFYEEI